MSPKMKQENLKIRQTKAADCDRVEFHQIHLEITPCLSGGMAEHGNHFCGSVMSKMGKSPRRLITNVLVTLRWRPQQDVKIAFIPYKRPISCRQGRKDEQLFCHPGTPTPSSCSCEEFLSNGFPSDCFVKISVWQNLSSCGLTGGI